MSGKSLISNSLTEGCVQSMLQPAITAPWPRMQQMHTAYPGAHTTPIMSARTQRPARDGLIASRSARRQHRECQAAGHTPVEAGVARPQHAARRQAILSG